MSGKSLSAAVTIFLLLVSPHVGRCAIFHGILDSVALPRIAEFTHGSASSTALAASAAYNEVKSYFDDFNDGVRRTFHDHFHNSHADEGSDSITSFSEKSARRLSPSKLFEKVIGSDE